MQQFASALRVDQGLARLMSVAGLGARSRDDVTSLAWTRLPGSPEAPDDALPIVLLHGLCGSQYHWSPVADRLRAFGDVVTIDLPGFGASPAPKRWTLDDSADAVIAQLDELGIERCLLVGHSLGASLAVRLASRESHRFDGFGLVSPAGFWKEPFAKASSKRFAAAFTIWRRGVLLGAGNVVKAPPMRLFAFFAMVHKPLQSLTRRESELLVACAAQGRSTIAAREAVVGADLFDDAKSIEQPVELVWGRKDRITPFDTAERVADAIPDVRTRFLDDVGHMVMFEDRSVVVDAVQSLVKRATPRS